MPLAAHYFWCKRGAFSLFPNQANGACLWQPRLIFPAQDVLLYSERVAQDQRHARSLFFRWWRMEHAFSSMMLSNDTKHLAYTPPCTVFYQYICSLAHLLIRSLAHPLTLSPTDALAHSPTRRWLTCAEVLRISKSGAKPRSTGKACVWVIVFNHQCFYLARAVCVPRCSHFLKPWH